jgi:hypothetical protein
MKELMFWMASVELFYIVHVSSYLMLSYAENFKHSAPFSLSHLFHLFLCFPLSTLQHTQEALRNNRGRNVVATNVFNRSQNFRQVLTGDPADILADSSSSSGGVVDSSSVALDSSPIDGDYSVEIEDTGVIACQCDVDGICNRTDMTAEDELFICIRASSSNRFQVVRVHNMTLSQNGGRSSTQIEDGRKAGDDYTWVVKHDDGSCTVRTRIDNSFLRPSYRARKRKTLKAEGSVVLMYQRGLQSDDISAFDLRTYAVKVPFRVTVPLRSFRLFSYLTSHRYTIAFFVLIFFLAASIASLVLGLKMLATSRRVSAAKSKPFNARQERQRASEVYNVWLGARGGKSGSSNDDETSLCTDATSGASSRQSMDSMRTSERFEESKEEIWPQDECDDVERGLNYYMPDSYRVR